MSPRTAGEAPQRLENEAREGDLLEVAATYKVTAGRLDDDSSQRSAPFIVSVAP